MLPCLPQRLRRSWLRQRLPAGRGWILAHAGRPRGWRDIALAAEIGIGRAPGCSESRGWPRRHAGGRWFSMATAIAGRGTPRIPARP